MTCLRTDGRQAVLAAGMAPLLYDILERPRLEGGHVSFQPFTLDLQALLRDVELMFRVRTDARRLQLTV